jgi:hypothetical protein
MFMAINNYETMLTGGHPNSLGNTIQVVDSVLEDKSRLKDLYDCYKSDDEVVRLRVSNAMKRVCRVKPEWVAEYLDGLTTDISKINQASTKWTLATLFMLLDRFMNDVQRSRAIEVMKHNLRTDEDWIVQNTTIESLAHFATQDDKLKVWLIPQLEKMTSNKHKSVARRSEKLLLKL